MRLHIEDPDRPVIPLSVVMAMVTYGIFWIWFLWIMCLVKFKFPSEGANPGMISLEAYWLGTFFSAGLIVWLGVALFQTLKRRDSLRRAHLVSIVMGITLMVSMQYGFEHLRAPMEGRGFVQTSLIETWSEMRARGHHPLNFWR